DFRELKTPGGRMSVLFLAPHITFPEGALPNVQMLLRWVHLIAGITWHGLLYFFNLDNIPFMKELDPSHRGKVVPALMLRALWWFRWASVVAVTAGIFYFMSIIHADAHNAQTSGDPALITFFLIW